MIDLSKMLNLPDLSVHLRAVDKCLLETVKSDNKQVYEAITRIIKAGGKRLRPSLVIACTSINDRPISQNAIKLAAAVELVHLGSLVHDDIIDEADTRWNIPTINAQEGTNQAIIIGDYLLAVACTLAASVGKNEAELIATTIAKLCEGQYFEQSEEFNINRSEEAYFKAIDGKTAALLSASCILGGMSAGLNTEQIKELGTYGYEFGITFQLIDDLMDLVSTEELYGKPVGNDVAEGVYTLPVIFGLESQAASEIKEILLTKKFDPKLTELLIAVNAIGQTLSLVHRHNKLAADSLEQFNSPVSLSLQKLPEHYLDWTTNNKIAKPYRAKIFKIESSSTAA